jgi:vitamin B12 transporter
MKRTTARRTAAISFTLATAALAQSVTNLHGTIKDPLGAIVPSATVELLDQNEQDKVVATTTSGVDGSYAFSVPTSTRYRVRITAPTFRVTVTAPIYLSRDSNEARDLTLTTPTYSDQVTVTANGTPTPLAQSGAPITVLTESQFPYSPEIQQPLRLVPGVQMTQTGQTGGTTELHIRGGESSANKVLLDGTPLNDIGGGVNFANLASIGISRVEVLRQPNSALYGSDALAGVVQLSSTRGTAPLPQLTYQIDGGNYGFLRQEADLSGAHGKFDYFNGFGRLNTSNSIAADAFHNATFAGNYGYAPNEKTDLRLTVRHLATNGGSPNAIALYGIADSAGTSEHDTYLNASINNQTTLRWHNMLQYGRAAIRSQYSDYAQNGFPDGFGDTLGAPVTLTGANGYTVSGQALFTYGGTYPNYFNTSTNRDFVYAQSDYRFTSHLTGLAAFRYEDERGFTASAPSFGTPPSTVDHGNYSYTLQLAGDVKNRMFYTLGSGIEDNAVYGKALTPRASVAYYLIRPAGQSLLSGTKLHGSFGKGIKGPTVGQETSSLYNTILASNPGLITSLHVGPLGANYSRTYDVGLEQQLGNGRARLNVSYFHNEFTNGVEYLSKSALIKLGIPSAAANATAFGAYTNSQAFRSLGGEAELEVRLANHLFARAGYTYLDAVVQRSFSSSALSPTFNTASNFKTIPIGQYGPLVGARPFRRAPHSGYFSLQYDRNRLDAQISGTLVSRRDDSTFLSDANFGNSLLLPNRNLDGAYQRLELTSSYRINSHITTYANLQNLLNQSYQESFGYPALPFNLRGGFKFTLGGESWRLH